MSAGRVGQAWEALRGLPDRTPLRVKMVTAVLALVAIALAVISITGITVLRNYLLSGADTQLQRLEQNAAHLQFGHNAETVSPEPWVFEALLPNGGGLQGVQGGYLPLGISGPAISANARWLTSDTGTFVTVPAQSGDTLWRVVAEPGQTFGTGPFGTQQQIGTLIVAVDVTNIYTTIGNVIRIDLIVSALLLFLLLIIGIAVVRASLRPLTDIEKTAGAIAAGDLTRRVPDLDPRTEVGRLAQSLNAMLAQIEMAFDARAESEFAARRSEERMRQFVADASHELRTPLTAIRGFAEYYRQRGGARETAGAADRPVLANGTGPPAPGGSALVAPRHGSNPEPEDRTGPLARADLDRIMQRVEQESSRMGLLVEDMLLLARLDQQRPLERSTVDMLTLAADAVHDARVVAPGRSINLTVGSGAALLVLGDEAKLRQVIGNLVSNALNHTPEGSPVEVRVRLGSLDEWRGATAVAHRRQLPVAGRAAFAVASPNAQPFPAVIFEIADQGPGLTPSQAEHVFERFYRADQARTRQSGGTGLGLAIVAALVAAHGGNVWVESPPGGGAIFRIAIPLAPEARNSAPDPDDGTDPDILDSHSPLSLQPTGPRGGSYPPPAGPAAPAYSVPPGPAAPAYSVPPGPAAPAYPVPPGPAAPAYPVPPGPAEPAHPAQPVSPEPGHAAPTAAPGPSRPRPGAPPLPKRRPGRSGHTRA